ncbi:MAG: hypothetical protein KDI32_12105 [Pseudomonadales bacterium]|jgi:hypothetical protein|nr:hypothetical protein [Pseudomonadales bacterium]
MLNPQPSVGDWYRFKDGEKFEVVAIDHDDGTIDLQYYDGTIEELDMEDWVAEASAGRVESIEPPEDWSGSVDVDPDDDEPVSAESYYVDDEKRQYASRLDDLDLFE